MTAQAGSLSGWGRAPVVEGREIVSEDIERITRGAALTRGLGRSYGDASLPAAPGDTIASSRLADRILAFDTETGLLRAEAGLSLHALNRLFVERGWFTPVSPGTQFVTLGGMVAADVHGKNHHAAGTFGRHVTGLRLRAGTGEIVDANGAHERELFLATQGGMGLTGHILEVEVQMKRIPSPWIVAETEVTNDLETLVERLREAGDTWPYTVSWSDFIGGNGRGRSVLVKGRWAEPEEAGERRASWPSQINVPVDLPSWTVNRRGVRLFNAAYFMKSGLEATMGIMHPSPFFYPLDVIGSWNRAYGRDGFTQYQCVLPYESGPRGYRRLLELSRSHGAAPSLVVIKDFGAEGHGTISFPRPGVTFAVDFPVRGRATQALVDTMNEFVIAEGGRVYLAKDAFTRREHFEAMEPRLPAFNAIRERWDPNRTLRSALSARLFGDAS